MQAAAAGEAACWKAVQEGTARPDDWFPESSRDMDRFNRAAIDTCQRCPLRTDCLRWALRAMLTGPLDSLPGIWGGTTQQQRMRMLHRRYGL